MTLSSQALWLVYLRWLRGLRRARIAHWGGLYNAAIIEIVVLGHLEGESWDTLSIAAELGYSRQTLGRWIDELVRDGHLEYVHRGRGNVLRPTQRTLDFLYTRRGLGRLKTWAQCIMKWEKEMAQ